MNEHEFIITKGELTVAVDKVGGGTLGKRYDGDWKVYRYVNKSVDYIPVYTGMPHDHEYVARMILDDYLV